MQRVVLRHGLPLLASVVPLLVLLRLILTALYAYPESDDYCFAYHYDDDGLIQTVLVFYNSVIGRIVPIVLMTAPAILSHATGIDMVVLYPLIMAASALAFVTVATFATGRIWPIATRAEKLFAGVAMSATIFGLAVSLREIIYWAPGVYSYMVPAAIVIVVFLELFTSAADGAPISSRAAAWITVLCFLGALSNEFTPLWLLAMISVSRVARWLTGHPFPQNGVHGLLLIATLCGFAILLLAPGNQIRMAQFPSSGNIGPSLIMAGKLAVREWKQLLREPTVWAWLLCVAILSAVVAPVRARPLRNVVVMLISAAALLFACTYAGSFVALYATGANLVTRAQNEVLVLMLVGLTFLVAASTRLVVPAKRVPSGWIPAVAILACGLLCLPLLNSRSMVLLRSEQPQFETFWLESMKRHAFLKLAPEADLVASNRTVRPSVLMGGDLTENPGMLPNDCIAAYYGKKSVVMHPHF